MPISKLLKYLQESRSELKKVAWPTKKEITLYTILVIVVSIAVAVFIGVADYFLNIGIEQFF